MLSPLTETSIGASGLIFGALAPLVFERWLMPAVSRRSRLQKYLRVLNAAAEAYRLEFVQNFDNPRITWADHVAKVLATAANEHTISVDDPTWKLAQRIFLNYGPGSAPEVVK